MSKTVQFKRGNANVSATYVGAQGEITVNTDNYTLNVHDGQTPGGFKILNSTIGNIGNIVVADQTISGTRSGTNITISPLIANTIINSRLFTPNVVIDGYTVRSISGDTAVTLPRESDGVDVELTNSFSNIKLTTFDPDTNVPYTLLLDTESHLTLPGSIKSDVGGAEIQFAGEQGLLMYADFGTGNTGISLNDSGLTEIFANVNLSIITDYAGAGHEWLFDNDGSMTSGNIIPRANVTYSLGSETSQWRDLWVSNNTIYIGGVALGVSSDGNLTVNGNTISGGGGIGPIQPYIELTNSPFIVQPAILSESVTITAAPTGNNARFTVVIGEGPVIESTTITIAGTGYVVGQRYRIWSYSIGGPNDASSIDFEVATVGENGELLTIQDVAFFGVASNVPGTYTNASIEYLPSVFDEIDTGLTLTRGRVQGLFNIDAEQEYDNNAHTSPLGTEWNSDGWGNLVSLPTRSYTTWRSALNNQVGNNIIGAELVMHDTINDKYYKFEFTEWGGNNGGFEYTRSLITDPNYFRKEDYGTEIDTIVPDDGEGSGIGITRGNNNSIYNPYREEGYNEEVSPAGTLWNIEGWDDLSNIESRTYEPFYAAFGGNLGNRVPGSNTVMYVPETGKYYAVKWLSWTQSNNGGGFSYVRYEIDLAQIAEGVKFADGTVLKSASGVGRVKSKASGNRRIEEVSGNKTVSLSQFAYTTITDVTSRAGTTTNAIYVSRPGSIYNITDNYSQYVENVEEMEFSLDNTTWYKWNGSGSVPDGEFGYYFQENPTLTYGQGDTVYFRYQSGGRPVIWWDKNDLPGGASDFRGAVIDYHAYTGQATIIGTIHIVDDSGENHITHTEVISGSSDSENDDLWLVQNEGTISYRRIDGESKTLKVHWTAKVFYGSEYYD